MSDREGEHSFEPISGRKWFLGYFLSNLAGGITSPLIPMYVLIYLHSNVFYVGLTSALVSAAGVPFLIFWGNISDRLGLRKFFILLGFLGGGVSLLGIAFANSVLIYIAVLAVFQIVIMASVPVSTMIIIENTSRESWPNMMSTFSMVSSAGTVLGLSIGTLAILTMPENPYYLVYLYIISALIYISAGIAVSVLIPEPERNIPRGSLFNIYSVRIIERIRYIPSNIIHIIGEKGTEDRSLTVEMWAFLISCAILMFAFQMFFVPFPAYMIESRKVSDTIIYLMYLGNSAMGAITYRFSGRAVNSYGPNRILLMSIVIRTVIFSIVASVAIGLDFYSYTVLVLVILYSVLGGVWSLISISQLSVISNGIRPSVRGRAIGYYNSLTGSGQIAAAVVAGYLSLVVGYGITFTLSAILVVLAAIITLRSVSVILNRKKKTASS